MKLIPFKHLSASPFHFEVKSNNVVFLGTLSLKEHHLAQLNGTIMGTLSLPCDRCGQDITHELNEDVSFGVYDGELRSEHEELDIVEVSNGIINMEELLDSELELIKSDYFHCPMCQGDHFEREF